MQNRNPLVVLLLTLLTFGIYGIYWGIVTASEMRARGADIPHWILLFIPFASFYWFYKYSLAVEQVSGGKTSGTLTFVLFVFIGLAAMYIAQDAFNQVGSESASVPSYDQPSSPSFTSQPQAEVAPVAAGVAGASFAAAPQAETAPTFTAQTPEPTPVTPPTVEAPVVQPAEPVAFSPAPEPVEPEPTTAPTVFSPDVTNAPEEPQVFQPQTPVTPDVTPVAVAEEPQAPQPPQYPTNQV